jgi:hypothetical protein
MKTFYLVTLVLIASIGAAIYLAVSYQPPSEDQAPPVAASSSNAAPLLALASSSSSTAAEAEYLPSSSSAPAATPGAGIAPSPVAPAAPVDLLVNIISPTQANLSWSPPADTTNVEGYAIYRNFSRIGVTPDTVFSDVTYSSQYTYSYNVTAYAESGLESAYSPTFTIEGDSGAAPSPDNLTPNPAPIAAVVTAPSPAPVSGPTPSQKPAAVKPVAAASASACGSGGSCTAAQIAAHNTRGDCWVYLSQINKAYNITAYVADPSLHPGGDVIAPHCGTDIYNYFLGTAGGHKHSSNALNNVLQAYYIGPMS